MDRDCPYVGMRQVSIRSTSPRYAVLPQRVKPAYTRDHPHVQGPRRNPGLRDARDPVDNRVSVTPPGC